MPLCEECRSFELLGQISLRMYFDESLDNQNAKLMRTVKTERNK